MRIIMDLHTHTIYSHGTGTVAQNAAEAGKKGLKLLGISDHGPAHSFFGVNARKMEHMRRDIDEINARMGGTFVLQGVEGNLLDAQGTTDIDKLKNVTLDIALLGYHQGSLPRTVQAMRFYRKALVNSPDIAKVVTNSLIRAMERYPVDAITHPGEYLPIDAKRLAQAAVYHGIVLEINNSHRINPANLRIFFDNGAQFLASSDAHAPERVGGFGNAVHDAIAAKIPAERIVNAEGYPWDRELRLNRIRGLLK